MAKQKLSPQQLRDRKNQRNRDACHNLSDAYLRNYIKKTYKIDPKKITDSLIKETRERIWNKRIEKAKKEVNRKKKLQRARSIIRKKYNLRAERLRGKKITNQTVKQGEQPID